MYNNVCIVTDILVKRTQTESMTFKVLQISKYGVHLELYTHSI